MRFLEQRYCPICHGPSTKLGRPLSFLLANTNQVVTQEYRYCEKCDFAFTHNPASQTDMEKYYMSVPRFQKPKLSPEDQDHTQEQVDFITNHHLTPVKNILEIGPFQPFFLNAFMSKTGAEGWFDELHAEAIMDLENAGLKDRRDGDEAVFDVIAMCHVFEHVLDPVEYLKALSACLTKDGLVFLEVPDFTCLDDNAVDDFQWEHVNYFSQHALTRCAESAGYNVVAVERTCSPGYATCQAPVLRALLQTAPPQASVVSTMPSQKQREGLWRALSERPLFAIDHIRQNIINGSKRVAFYGAGTRTLEILAYLDNDELPVKIFDKDPQKIGASLRGVMVQNPKELNPAEFDVFFVSVIGFEVEVMSFFGSLGVPRNKIQTWSSVQRIL